MNNISEYDQRQLKKMQECLSSFQKKQIQLGSLIGSLEFLFNAMQSVADSWKDDFQAEINSLEMIQDSIEDGSISRWKGNFKEDIYKSVSTLKKMTTAILEEYLKISDPNVLESAIEINCKWLMCPKCNDTWESNSVNAMVVCPQCDCAFHNPRAS